MTAISIETKLSKAVVRKYLVPGADEPFLLADDAFEKLGSYSVALILAVAIKKIGEYGLILTDWKAGSGYQR